MTGSTFEEVEQLRAELEALRLEHPERARWERGRLEALGHLNSDRARLKAELEQARAELRDAWGIIQAGPNGRTAELEQLRAERGTWQAGWEAMRRELAEARAELERLREREGPNHGTR